MAKPLIWTEPVLQQLGDILEYFCERNGSSEYSEKLHAAFMCAVETIQNDPQRGVKYDCKGRTIRYVIVAKNYQLFYEVTAIQINIIKVWDARRNPGDLSFE